MRLDLMRKAEVGTFLSRYDKAVLQFEHAIEIDPDNAEACSKKGVALASSAGMMNPWFCFDRAKEIDPTKPKGWYNRGRGLAPGMNAPRPSSSLIMPSR